MWVPVAGPSLRLTLSILTGCGRVRVLGTGVGTRKDLAKTPRRAFSDSLAQPLPCPETVESPSCVPKYRLDHKRYVTSPGLAETLALLLQRKRGPPSLILECNPGPGILTQALLKTGARVVALESERTFIPHLERLEQSRHSVLAEWRTKTLKVLMLACSSSSVTYLVGLFSLLQELPELGQQKLYFIRMTPRRNLFTENLTPVNYNVFFYMLKHCFGKRNAKIADHLPSISPVDAVDILMQIRKHKNVKTINMYPEDFKHLFETIECSKDYTYKWLCEDIVEEIAL
ncbi:dimethyladenosine transferase 2, mitochondrial [Echinops telfairi]|uniref:Dimethyladenosine transferase 2, mitochondrial n=1 Tax=Echinops telfairi TaxID=9371 RepID=A0AC55DQX3_ECHTE|nr:dimethyladenosine transferase 2, mitochondrial [Echinops telfairi]